jgi:hypothetical protein
LSARSDRFTARLGQRRKPDSGAGTAGLPETFDAGGGGLRLDYIRLFVPGADSRTGLDLAESGLEFEQLQELWEDEVIGRPQRPCS